MGSKHDAEHHPSRRAKDGAHLRMTLRFAEITRLIFPAGQITRCCVQSLSRLRIISDFQKLSLTPDPT
ncbi:hypothetical protein, partial [Bradyrhizobium sp. S69]|uniref:hypothetical protein n=1 Tax=Bradyrhizobium sp. S69 TaxID=1641856 RepID=UPI001AEE2723